MLATACQSVVVIGRESVGKSQLVAALSGRPAFSTNFRGSTVAVTEYRGARQIYVDTPGILRQSDSETTRLALDALEESDTVLLVVQATQLDEDLSEMLPLTVGRPGLVVVTYWDKVEQTPAAMTALERLADEAGVPFVAVDARHLSEDDRDRIESGLAAPGRFAASVLRGRAGWHIEARPGWLDHPIGGPAVALLLLVLPALATIYGANALANWLHPLVSALVEPAITSIDQRWPAWAKLPLIGRHGEMGYGLLNMGPFLLVWAFPTVLLFSLILAFYQSTGLIERINGALHPLVRPLGLSGRDVVRVMMGFGCNVPAVISTRACSACSRHQAISAISFGAACSYQLPATLAVLTTVSLANQRQPLVLSMAFLGYLLLTTLIYLRLTAPRAARSSWNLLLTPRRPFMQWPAKAALLREARASLAQFVFRALPVFVVICLVAALLAELQLLDRLSRGLAPAMSLFNLPPSAALPVVLASVRKDGIFLLAADDGLAIPLTPSQALTAVYLAGVLLPCLVTALTIRRETGWRPAIRLLARQAAFAVAFSFVLAWSGRCVLD